MARDVYQIFGIQAVLLFGFGAAISFAKGLLASQCRKWVWFAAGTAGLIIALLCLHFVVFGES